MDGSDGDGSDTDGLFDSPDTKHAKQRAQIQQRADSKDTHRPANGRAAHPVGEEALQAELQGLQKINSVVEDVIASLEKAKANMATVNTTIGHSQTLLQTWTRILSATEHNQRLILNPNWHGASQDLVDMENEESQRAAAIERRHAEEQARREEAARHAEDEERKRALTAQTTTKRSSSAYGRSARGRVTGSTSRGGLASSSTSNTTAGSVSHLRAPSRGGSVGRAPSTTTRGVVRGRGRGLT